MGRYAYRWPGREIIKRIVWKLGRRRRKVPRHVKALCNEVKRANGGQDKKKHSEIQPSHFVGLLRPRGTKA